MRTEVLPIRKDQTQTLMGTLGREHRDVGTVILIAGNMVDRSGEKTASQTITNPDRDRPVQMHTRSSRTCTGEMAETTNV